MKRPEREANSLSHSSFHPLERVKPRFLSHVPSPASLHSPQHALQFAVIRLDLQSGVSRRETADSLYNRFVWLQLLLQHVVSREFGSSGMLCCVIVPYFYLQCKATSKLPGRLDTDDEGSTMFRNVADHQPDAFFFSGSNSCRKLLDPEIEGTKIPSNAGKT